MNPPQNPAEEPTREVHRHAPETNPTAAMPMPPEPENIDELLADSLKAQSEKEFTWKEPEKRPRWWQRAETEQGGELSATPRPDPVRRQPASSPVQKSGPRVGQLVFAAMCLILALWTVMTVMFGVFLDPLIVALGICTLGGVALVVGGLLPRPGRRV